MLVSLAGGNRLVVVNPQIQVAVAKSAAAVGEDKEELYWWLHGHK